MYAWIQLWQLDFPWSESWLSFRDEGERNESGASAGRREREIVEDLAAGAYSSRVEQGRVCRGYRGYREGSRRAELGAVEWEASAVQSGRVSFFFLQD